MSGQFDTQIHTVDQLQSSPKSNLTQNIAAISFKRINFAATVYFLTLLNGETSVFQVCFTFMFYFSPVDLHDGTKHGCWEIYDTAAKRLVAFFMYINVDGPNECHVRCCRAASVKDREDWMSSELLYL